MTSETSTEALRARIASLADSLARTSLRQAAGPDSAAPAATSGSSSPASFAYLSRTSSSSRTSPDSRPRPVWISTQESLLSESFCPTWPRRGTWASGFACELPTWERRTDETGSSSSLLPTPDASVFNDGQSVEAYRERKERELEKNYNGNGGGTPLAMMVRLLPTPGAWLGRRPENSMADPERASSRSHEGVRGKRSIELPDAIAAEVKLLPTPTTQDGANTAGPSQYKRNSDPLNVVVVKASSGADSTSRSDSGNDFSDGPLPGQLTLEDG